MTRIKVVESPTAPRFVPEYVQRYWIGVEMPVAEESPEGYVVLREDALEALNVAKRGDAFSFWSALGPQLLDRFPFPREICQVIN